MARITYALKKNAERCLFQELHKQFFELQHYAGPTVHVVLCTDRGSSTQDLHIMTLYGRLAPSTMGRECQFKFGLIS